MILSPGPGFSRDPANQRADIKESGRPGGRYQGTEIRGFYSDYPTPLVVQWDFLTPGVVRSAFLGGPFHSRPVGPSGRTPDSRAVLRAFPGSLGCPRLDLRDNSGMSQN